MKLLNLFICFCVAALAVPFTARADINEFATGITDLPYVIKHPGLYILRVQGVYKHLAGAAITIDTDDVTLDLGDRSLTNTPNESGATSAVGVAASTHQNITIRNGSLRNFYDGINVDAVGGHIVIQNVTCDGCLRSGVNLVGDDIQVRNCIMRDLGGAAASEPTIYGISAVGNNVSVVGNQITKMHVTGSQQAVGISTGLFAVVVVDGNLVANPDSVANSIGIAGLGSSVFLTGNRIADFATGISMGSTAKYSSNLTLGCNTSFTGGTSAGGNN